MPHPAEQRARIRSVALASAAPALPLALTGCSSSGDASASADGKITLTRGASELLTLTTFVAASCPATRHCASRTGNCRTNP